MFDFMADNAQVIPALIQIPFILSFIWFALRMSHDYRKDAKERDEHWMEFLTLEREQRKMAMDQGMLEVKEMTEGMIRLTQAIADLAKSVAEHNIGAVERHKSLFEIVKNG